MAVCLQRKQNKPKKKVLTRCPKNRLQEQRMTTSFTTKQVGSHLRKYNNGTHARWRGLGEWILRGTPTTEVTILYKTPQGHTTLRQTPRYRRIHASLYHVLRQVFPRSVKQKLGITYTQMHTCFAMASCIGSGDSPMPDCPVGGTT